MVALTAFFLFSPLLGCEESLRSAAAALQQHDSAKANAILEAASAPCSQSPDFFDLVGAARSLSGNLPGAEEAFRKAVALSPKSARLQTNFGIACLQNHHVPEGIAALERSIALGSSDPRVLFTLGSWFGEHGDYQKAVAYLSRIPEGDVDDAVSFNLGLGYSHLRQFEKARQAYFKAIDQRPGHAEAYFRVGLDYAAGGEPRKAIPWLLRARELSGNRPDIAYALAEQLLRLKYTKTAEEIISAALEKSPRDPFLIAASGDLLQQKGDYAAAISKYQDALSQQPHLSAALIGLAQVEIAKGDNSEARTYLLQVLAADPANSLANGQLGVLEGQRGNWEFAAAHLKSAWEADQSNTSIGLELARALRHCGQFSHALEILKSLEPQMRDSNPFHLELATLYVQLHRTADAQAERAIVANLQSQAHQDLRFQDSQTYVY
jgi:tetratricopeptide (TPR) repeat protein